MEPIIREQKKAARKRLSERLMTLDSAYVSSAGKRIEDKLLASDEYKDARCVFVYVSTGNEPSTREIMKRALDDGKELYVPKCLTLPEMLAVRIKDISDLIPGTMGILEPSVITETKDASELDLIIVPCISASYDGKRLGHGAGCYDRFLEGCADKAVVLCFSRMTDPDIPVDEHDVLIPKVITE